MNMVDGVLLLVDAAEGPMPQTRFVLKKALERGHKAIVVINKVDRKDAEPERVLNQTFDLFIELGASDEQADFPVIYAQATAGRAGRTPDLDPDLQSMFDVILNHIPAPKVDPEAPLQLLVTTLGYDDYRGVTAVGRIFAGTIKAGQKLARLTADGKNLPETARYLYTFVGLNKVEVPEATAGDIVSLAGLEGIGIGETLADPANPVALPTIKVEEPTVRMTFAVNDSPFAGREGKYVTSRQLRERLFKELQSNVALKVNDGDTAEEFEVSGRGELHLSILIENMRREGYELAVSRPEVIVREIDGEPCEPYEQLTVDVEEQHQGAVMEKLGDRRGELLDMQPDGKGRVRLDYLIPARGLIGFQTEFLTTTSGTGLLYHVFDRYGPVKKGAIGARINGVLIANSTGKALAYALFNLQERGRLMVGPGDEVYEGMIVGIHSRDNDLVVNPLKAKQLTNIRAAGSDENIFLTPPVRMSLEQALEFIDDDELVEVTPKAIRLRKKLLLEHERKRSARREGN